MKHKIGENARASSHSLLRCPAKHHVYYTLAYDLSFHNPLCTFLTPQPDVPTRHRQSSMADPGALRQPFPVAAHSAPAPQPPPSAPTSTQPASAGAAAAAPPMSTTSAPSPTPAAASAPNPDAGSDSNGNASSPHRGRASSEGEDYARQALAIKLLEKEYFPELLEFQFVKGRSLGVIVEDLKDVVIVMDVKEENGMLCLWGGLGGEGDACGELLQGLPRNSDEFVRVLNTICMTAIPQQCLISSLSKKRGVLRSLSAQNVPRAFSSFQSSSPPPLHTHILTHRPGKRVGGPAFRRHRHH